MTEIIETVKFVSRIKGSSQPWKPLNIKAIDLEDAIRQIRGRSLIVNNALDLAVRVTTLYIDNDECEHGVPCGEWCETCNRQYKEAAKIQ